MVIIDEKFAQRFWPDSDPIGKHLWFDPKKPVTIVGVVGVVKQYDLETDGKIATYLPQRQHPGNRMFLAVRTSSEGLSSAVVSQIHAVDPDVVVYGIRTMQERVHDSLARQRFSSTMLGAFAAFALLLAAVGLYGVMSHLVTQSTHDMMHRGVGVPVPGLGPHPGKAVNITIPIEEGERYKMGLLRIVSADPDKSPSPQVQVLKVIFPLHEGDIFSVSKVRKALENYGKVYGEYGFSMPFISYSTTVRIPQYHVCQFAALDPMLKRASLIRKPPRSAI